MSFEEKRVWLYAVVAVVVPVIYFAVVLGQAPDTDVADIAYGWPMLTAVGVAVAVNIGGSVAAALVAPAEANQKDERDTHIDGRGLRVEYHVFAIGVVVALALTLAEFEYFWIGNVLYLAFVLAALTSSVVKIHAYRRGC